MEGYRWHDSKWVKNRTKNYDCPLNIYEASLGSWKMKRESEGEVDGRDYFFRTKEEGRRKSYVITEHGRKLL